MGQALDAISPSVAADLRQIVSRAKVPADYLGYEKMHREFFRLKAIPAFFSAKVDRNFGYALNRQCQ